MQSLERLTSFTGRVYSETRLLSRASTSDTADKADNTTADPNITNMNLERLKTTDPSRRVALDADVRQRSELSVLKDDKIHNINNFIFVVLLVISPTPAVLMQVNEWLGVCWSFWMYAIFCLIAAPFTKYLLPDTQGLSLDQIQRLVNQPWNTKWSRKPDLVI
ncbi:hypothetical protein J6590_063415 [Homalodisca vitripennis]|nr:hypothetical protein J6590_063415 [Homalodisca vitripennis]